VAPPAVVSKRVFTTAVYEPDKQGVLRPVLPLRCTFATAAETCRLFVDHYRPRKTGPRFPLAVIGCSAHPKGRYTLYPPGHFPYGRESVAPYSPSGVLYTAVDAPTWETTFFAAALDAAKGEGWPSESPWDDSRRRRTQGRRLRFAALLVGVHPSVKDALRERIATRLAVPVMRLREEARRWDATWTTRGAAVVAVLEAIPVAASLGERILAAGTAGGLWSEPRAGRAVITRSGRGERPRAKHPGPRGPPPTTSPVSEASPPA